MGVFHAIGGLVVYSVGPFMSYAGIGYVVMGLNVVYIVLCCFLPESPMYYVIKGGSFALDIVVSCVNTIDVEYVTSTEILLLGFKQYFNGYIAITYCQNIYFVTFKESRNFIL